MITSVAIAGMLYRLVFRRVLFLAAGARSPQPRTTSRPCRAYARTRTAVAKTEGVTVSDVGLRNSLFAADDIGFPLCARA